ncbi:MAG: hypothetical protein DRN60_00290 [Thaumarchaeota archaeon]|nr:MAG: hypothetical protein DRN60_00290 [Nitrososphaerota archaeon]
MVLIEYEAKDTIIHRLNPVSKIVWLGGLGLLLAMYLEPQPLIIVFAWEVFIGCLAGISWRKLLSRAWWAFVASIFGGIIVMFWVVNPEQFWRVPRDLACKTLIQLTPPGTPILGHTAITYGGLIWFTAGVLRITIAIIAACIFTFSVPLSDLTSLWSMFLPYKLSFILTSGLRFYPVMAEKTQDIITAAKSRGWDITSKNPVKRVKAIYPIIFPIVREAADLANRMALAAEVRAFGVKRPTRMTTLKFTPSDIFFIMFNVFITGTLVYLWWFCGLGKL